MNDKQREWSDKSGNLRAIVRLVFPGFENSDFEALAIWPPDLFAITSSILGTTGLYRHVLEHLDTDWNKGGTNQEKFPSSLDVPGESKWAKSLREAGRRWGKELAQTLSNEERVRLNRKTAGTASFSNEHERALEIINSLKLPTPSQVSEHWSALTASVGDDPLVGYLTLDNASSISALPRGERMSGIGRLLSLHVLADEACARLLTSRKDSLPTIAPMLEALLSKRGSLSRSPTWCSRVLPKRLTPDVGLTLRSLSASVGFHRSSVDVAWHARDGAFIKRHDDEKFGSLNALLLPWPLKLHAENFVACSSENNRRHGFFAYSSRSTKLRALTMSTLEDVLAEARKEATAIDFVIMPEGALDEETLHQCKAILAKNEVKCFIIGCSGHRGEAPNSLSGYSKVVCGFLNDKNEYIEESQNKHHRWRLTAEQVRQYQLGYALGPRTHWWEAIAIPQRHVNFFDLKLERPESEQEEEAATERSEQVLTLCSLICEDLARQDPISDLVRTVGPSLVVALLLDGPQLKARWPGRYAAVLADDPGSAVLTLTSLGMVKRTHPGRGEKSTAIALWRDNSGRTEEIEIEPDAVGVLLGLGFRWAQETIVGNRPEPYSSAEITLTSMKSVGKAEIALEESRKRESAPLPVRQSGRRQSRVKRRPGPP